MDVIDLPVESLIEYGFNNRVHGEQQVDRIANSIRDFGFNQPVVVDDNNVILVGHGRVAAAKKLGLETVPVLRREGLTDAQKRAYRILDNKLQNDSEWHFENLQLELDRLLEDNYPIEDWGLTDLNELMPEQEAVATDDEFDVTPPKETFLKRGDLIELGAHRLKCGDSTSEEDVDDLMAGNLADMVLTDPPYGVSYVGKTKDALTIDNDELEEPELIGLVLNAFNSAQRVSRPGAYWYATVPPGPLHILFADDWKKRGILRQIMVWVKDSMVLGHSEYHYRHEPILFGWLPGKRHSNADRTRTTVWEFDRPKANREHPTMKPIPLWAQAIKDGSVKGEIVYDCFLGSGTTLLAAEQLGRRCFGMELSPNYCEVIIRRYADQVTKDGGKPVIKVNGEEIDLAIMEA